MKYLFFISWLRAREKKLVDQVDLDRMIGASNMEESFKVLNDTDYGLYISNKKYTDIENVIEEERFGLKNSLAQMGMDEETIHFLFLKDDLMFLAQELKNSFFKKGEKGRFMEKYQQITEEIEKDKPKNPEEIDDSVVDIYFQKSIDFCLENKEKEITVFLKKYQKELQKREENLKERDEILSEMEEEIIEKSRDSISGLLPILAYFIKKRRIEYFIRSIFSAKRMGLNSAEIYKLITPTRTL